MYIGLPWIGGKHNSLTPEEFALKIIDKNIIGLVQGNSEYGARALGNRSILCLPCKGMKDRLNSTIKYRESFRPFSPLCREEDKTKWFESKASHLWMSHNAKVVFKNDTIESIVHADNTARLQTITSDSNPYLYKVLTVMDSNGVQPILLNTSFNVQGKPILNNYEDAMWMLNNTGLDELVIL